MPAGLQYPREYIDQKVGSVALQLRQLLDTADHLTRTLGAFDQAALIGKGYTEQDATDLRDSLYALSMLVNIVYGNAPLPTATDLRVGLAKVTGID